MRKLNDVVDIIIGRTKRFFLDTDNRKLMFWGIVAFLGFIVIPAFAETYQHQYKQICVVYGVFDDCTGFIDPSGEVFGVEQFDFEIGDTYEVTFFDNFTDHTRKDDVIVKFKKVD